MLIDNIIAQADIKNQEYRIFLCKMNKSIIRELTAESYNKVYSPQLGGATSFSFNISKRFNGQNVLNYSDIQGRNFIKLQQGTTVIGYFEIQNISTQNDGIYEFKEVKCLSSEIKLINKQLYLTTGTFKLVNNSNPSTGLLNIITSKVKSWGIGYIDPSLTSKERYFDIASVNVYELLQGQVQQAFECVIKYDTINNLINIYALANYDSNSPIIISMDNIIQSATIDTVTEEVVTRLHLYGDNEVSVYDVNLGQDYIDNFAYYKNTTFMSQELINALDTYDVKVASYQSSYTTYITNLTTTQNLLTTANADLLVLQGQLETLEVQKSYLIAANSSIVSINSQIASKQSEITTKNNQITQYNNQITAINNGINSIMIALDMNNNFTNAQLVELDQFIIEDNYQDSSYLVTDSFTFQQKIDVENQLLQSGKQILSRVSYPRYRIKINVVDFLKNVEFAYWWDKLYIGDNLRINVDDTFVTNVRVTGYTHNWDDNNLEIQLGDKYQLDDANIQLLDLLKNAVSAGTFIDYKSFGISNTVNTVDNQVLDFINSSIDVSKNAIVSGTNVGIKIDGSGLLATSLIPNTTTISLKQLRVANNSIVLSNDGFTTAKMAIGELANGLYGIAAEVIAGKMILGNNMIIETGNGDFRVDGTGVNITKMSLNMTSANGLNKITLDPNNGFKIGARPNQSVGFSDKFYVDTNGNLQFTGNLNGASGTFSGTVSASSIVGGSVSGATVSGVNITGSTAVFGTTKKITLDSTSSFGRILFSNEFNSTIGGLLLGNDNTISLNSSFGTYIVSSGQIQINSSAGRVSSNGESLAYLSDITSKTYYGSYPIQVSPAGGNDYVISLDNSWTPSGVVGTSQDLRLQIYNGYLEVYLDGSYFGKISII